MGGLYLCEYTPLPQTKNITTLKLSGLGQVPTPPSVRRVTASAGRLGRLGQGAGGMREGWQSLTSLGCPIIQGYSGQRQKERLSRSGGGWGSMGLLSPARRVLMGPAPARTGSSMYPVPWDMPVHAGQLCPYTESGTPGPSLAQGYLSQLPSPAPL